MDDIKTIKDPEVQKLMAEASKEVHPFYHAIGTLGGNATKEKYAKGDTDKEKN